MDQTLFAFLTFFDCEGVRRFFPIFEVVQAMFGLHAIDQRVEDCVPNRETHKIDLSSCTFRTLAKN